MMARAQSSSLIAEHPEVAEEVRALLNPDLTEEEFFELIGKINDRQQPEKEGLYDSVTVDIKSGRQVTVKYFQNGRLTVTGSLTS